MPTARELLEQADALMRRNRTLPPATSRPVPPPAEPRPAVAPSAAIASPRPIQREPIAPSVVHTALPLDEPTDTAEFTEPLPTPARALPTDAAVEPPPAPTPRDEPADDMDFPVLTDAVEPSARLDTFDEDLPLLTDAVTEIGGVVVDEGARGEPSLWELTSRGDSSVLGPAPDSVIVVPSAQAPPVVPQAPPEGRDPLGLDQPAPGFTAESAFDASRMVTGGAGVAEDAEPVMFGEPASARETPRAVSTERGASPDAYTDEDDEPHVYSAAVERLPPEDEEEAAVGAGVPFEDERAAPPVAEASAERIAATAAPATDGTVESDAPTRAFVDDDVAGSANAASLSGVPLGTPTSAFDQQRIREIAEEIGMQVLQRIDIFTDTTLRAQLGERLRPVVDRAAADLVTAINEHVGELLRAQVAEAIEREIESWRNR